MFTVHPDPAPTPVGCEGTVDELAENPDGVVQDPEAVVQAWNAIDLMAVALGTVKSKVYVVEALATELPIVTERPVIWAAETVCPTEAITKTNTAKPRSNFDTIFFMSVFHFSAGRHALLW